MSSGWDLVVQAAVGFGAAGIGAFATLRATGKQIRAVGDAQQSQLDTERKAAAEARDEERKAAQTAREQERKAILLDMIEAAKEEMRVTAEGAQTRVVGWIPMSVEFTHQLLVSHRIVDHETNLFMTAAFLTAQRYNTAAAIANRASNPGDSPAASALDSLTKEAAQAMANAATALARQLTLFPIEDLPRL